MSKYANAPQAPININQAEQKAPSLYQEVENLRKEINGLSIDNQKLHVSNEQQFALIQDLNNENAEIAQMYDFRGKLLKARNEKIEFEDKFSNLYIEELTKKIFPAFPAISDEQEKELADIRSKIYAKVKDSMVKKI